MTDKEATYGAARGLELRKNSKGRGVYATKVFVRDDVVEEAPVIVVPASGIKVGSILDKYTYEWDVNGRCVAIALGYGVLYNHSYTPNVRYETVVSQRVIRIIAIKSIYPHDELTMNYNGNPRSKKPVPFKVKP